MSSSSHHKQQFGRGESSRSHKYSSNKDSKHKKHSSSKSNASSSGRSSTSSLRFLFVVNEVRLDPNVNHPYAVDSWLNAIPPKAAEAYGQEYVGQVFLYDGGHVSPAPDHAWYRPALGEPGSIIRQGLDGSFHRMVSYKTGTVFACSPHLPIIVSESDVSCEPTEVFKPCACNDDESYRWNLPSFDKRNGTGLSLVNAEAIDSPYVAGRNPSWIPALLPKVFENPDDAQLPPSSGLGGDLPTIIGLMAFHSRRGRASDVFAEGRWQQNRWHGIPRAPGGYPNSQHPSPRGFVVHVAIDFIDDDSFPGDVIDQLKYDVGSYECRTAFVQG